MINSTIKHYSVKPLNAELVTPFRTALGEHNRLENLLFTVTLADGTVGYGEAAVASHITGETVELTRKNLHEVGDTLTGKDAADYLRISHDLHERLAGNMAAVAAVEMAVVDALCRQNRVPLWRLYGQRPVKVRTDITIVIDGLEETIEATRAFYRQGFRAFKVKIGRDADEDLQRVLAVTGIIKSSRLYLDANQGYTGEQTLRFLKSLDKHGVKPDLVEQPVPRDDWEGLKRVTRLSDVPIAADESVSSLRECMRAIREKAVDVINVKLMKSGLIEAREIVLWSKAAGLGVMIGGMMESSIAMTCSAHLAAGLGCIDYCDLDTPFFLKDQARHPYLSSSGVYDLSASKPGIGIVPKTQSDASRPRKNSQLSVKGYS